VPLSTGSSSAEGSKEMIRDLKIDTTNRYPSVVMLTVHEASMNGSEVECSGILIAPRLVLTAASCMHTKQQPTAPSRGTGVTLDATACAVRATVTFVTYAEPLSGEDLRSVITEYKGRVRCHPHFKMVLSRDGRIASSVADLAVVTLETAVKDVVPFSLVESAAKAGEALKVVGYTRNPEWGGIHRRRLFSQGEGLEAASPAEGVFLMNRALQPTDAGLGGGPCFREVGGNLGLVGIINRRTSEYAMLTDVQFHKGWLSNEIRQAESQE